MLGRIGTHTFFIFYFSEKKKYNFMHFERHFSFHNALNYIFSENPKQILGFTGKFRQGRVTLNTDIFFIS